LQQDFYLGQLWFIINCFVFILLLRATYAPSSSARLMAWYIYCLSIFTDIISLIAFTGRVNDGGIKTFVFVMALFLLIPKPVFLFFLRKSLKAEGVDLRQGIKYSQLNEKMVDNNNNDNINNNNINNNNFNNSNNFNNNNSNNFNNNNSNNFNNNNINNNSNNLNNSNNMNNGNQQRFSNADNNPSNNSQDFLNSDKVYPVISSQ